MSFTAQILTGLLLGVLTGLFLGEIAAPFSIGGDVFIGLLQMTVLPYIVVSLVGNLGKISWERSRGMLLAAVSVLAFLLMLGIAILFVGPFAFPEWEAGSFFSNSLVEQAEPMDLVALYVPANPFGSLANNVVPAVVLFSILLGVGISGVPGNTGILRALDVLADGLNRINKLVIKLTPYGVFAIGAGTAGTISVAAISRLQAYLITYTVLALLLAFLVLPLLVTALTPFRYRDLLSIPRDSLITIFAAAKIIVLMPQLVDNIKELFRRYELEDENVDSGAEVLMPLAYPFPNLGTYVILIFVPFAAWYMGRTLDWTDQLTLQSASLLSSFVAPIMGVPFLLDLMHIPADAMKLFVMSTVYTDRIRVVLGAVHLLMLTIVVLAYRRGVFEVNARRLFLVVLVSVLALGGALILVRSYLTYVVSDSYRGEEALVDMRWMEGTLAVKAYKDSLPEPNPHEMAPGRLETIGLRGTIRVAYLPDSLPFAFSNHIGEIVGFDIELAHHLARDLDVGLELVLVRYDDISDLFASGQIDIVMSGLAMTSDRIRRWNFGGSPIDLTLAFLVPDHRRKEFAEFGALRSMQDLTLGVVLRDTAFHRQMESAFPNARIVSLRSPREFLRGNLAEIDAVVYSAEGGSSWTLIYPGYAVVVPQPGLVRIPTGYPVPSNDENWSRYVSGWIELKRKDGTISALFDHWIRGKGADSTEPRWSLIRDVLGWVE